MKRFFIKPAPGIKLYDPETGKFLNPAGQLVKKTSYWSRRVADGGAILVEKDQAKPTPPAPAPPAPAKSKKEKKGK